jgi:cytochrome d ubiquinol oxidase subunit I
VDRLGTADAVNPAPGLFVGLIVVLAVYVVLTIGTVYVLRRLARRDRRAAPQAGGTPA